MSIGIQIADDVPLLGAGNHVGSDLGEFFLAGSNLLFHGGKSCHRGYLDKKAKIVDVSPLFLAQRHDAEASILDRLHQALIDQR